MNIYKFEELKQKLYNNYTQGKSDREMSEILERFTHTLGVVVTAKKLAGIYGEDIEKAEIAALLHDCAKFIKYDDFVKKYNIEIDKSILKYKKVIHGFLGYHIAKIEYGVQDEEILNAIKYHTTGKPNMSKLEKIIYLADATEPNREDYPGLEELRKLTAKSLDSAMKFMLDRTIKYVAERNLELCELTQEAYEWYENKDM